MGDVTKRLKGSAAVARNAAAEGIVLLKNENHLLPVSAGSKVALFGIGQIYTIKGGTGSGEVNNIKSVNILEGLEKVYTLDQTLVKMYQDWADTHQEVKQGLFAGAESCNYNEETPLGGLDLKAVAARNDVAIYVVSRIAGEGEDMKAEEGHILLTQAERKALKAVCENFEKTILLLNTAGYMEVSDVLQDVSSLLFVGLPGQEGGHAIADVLTGKVPVTGRINDTWPCTYKDHYDYEQYSTMIPSGNRTVGGYQTMESEQTLVPYHEGIYVGYRYFDTFGKDVLFPFGFGLNYGAPKIYDEKVTVSDEIVKVGVRVKNECDTYAAKEVVQVYVSAPDGKLEKPYQELKGYKKTSLLAPKAEEKVEIEIPLSSLASYDEASASYILEPGIYYIRVGADSRATKVAGALKVTEELCTLQLQNKMGNVPEGFEILSKQGAESISYETEEDEKAAAEEKIIIVDSVSTAAVCYSDEYESAEAKPGTKFQDVIAGKATAEELAASMDLEDLAAIVCGIGMDFSGFDLSAMIADAEKQKEDTKLSNDETKGEEGGEDIFATLTAMGNADPANFVVKGEAGQSPDFREKYGIPPLTLADGPAGVRLTRDIEENGEIIAHQYCTAFPTGSLLACTFNPEVIETFGSQAGIEMDEYHVDLWLAPGMNIHRSHLCGRNFEYYSEDPILSGTCAAAVTRGVQSHGVGVTIKHFAGNNQEFMRGNSNDLVTERALREIYLKGFEICVRTAEPKSVMTSYNDINGVPSADNHDMLTSILRDEWGFDGFVMTDWGGGVSTPAISMYAGNDMIQPGGPADVEKLLTAVNAGEEVISQGMAGKTHTPVRADLEKSAANIIKVILRSKPAMERV